MNYRRWLTDLVRISALKTLKKKKKVTEETVKKEHASPGFTLRALQLVPRLLFITQGTMVRLLA